MTFDNWFKRWMGERPTSITLASLRQQMLDARERAREAENKWRAANEWEEREYAARCGWKARDDKANK